MFLDVVCSCLLLCIVGGVADSMTPCDKAGELSLVLVSAVHAVLFFFFFLLLLLLLLLLLSSRHDDCKMITPSPAIPYL